ncbi:hypothetical protein A7K94_0210780 [Modestobacter sp. VKM Ac-2676]|nr:hypothetical protein A7K94_0210780 [Modestobacter sp. VKM Ac-2676]
MLQRVGSGRSAWTRANEPRSGAGGCSGTGADGAVAGFRGVVRAGAVAQTTSPTATHPAPRHHSTRMSTSRW